MELPKVSAQDLFKITNAPTSEERYSRLSQVLNDREEKITEIISSLQDENANLCEENDSLTGRINLESDFKSLKTVLHFKEYSTSVKKKDREAIKKIAEFMVKHTNCKIELHGYVEGLCLKDRAHKLSQDRANALKKAIEFVVPNDKKEQVSARIDAIGKGYYSRSALLHKRSDSRRVSLSLVQNENYVRSLKF